MEQQETRKKQKSIAPVIVALSLIAVAAVLVYKNHDDVIDFGESVIKQGRKKIKKGLKQSSFFKDRFSDLVDLVENRLKKVVA